MRRIKLIAIILLGLGLTKMHAQTMYVKEKNGTQTVHTLSNIKSLTFSDENIKVQKTDNSIAVYALSELRYLNFEDITLGLEEQIELINTPLITYPNPLVDVLNIELTGHLGEGTISILTFEGKVLHEEKTAGAKTITINLSQLPRGIYLCQYANEKEIKTVTILKQ